MSETQKLQKFVHCHLVTKFEGTKCFNQFLIMENIGMDTNFTRIGQLYHFLEHFIHLSHKILHTAIQWPNFDKISASINSSPRKI